MASGTQPAARPLGTVTVRDVDDDDVIVAAVLPKLTVSDEPRFDPLMVIDDPAAPEVGLRELITGAGLVVVVEDAEAEKPVSASPCPPSHISNPNSMSIRYQDGSNTGEPFTLCVVAYW